MMNIVLLHAHDLGRYVQPYGQSVRTPGFQRLAEEGVIFRRAFSTAPTCSPSRASLFTGQYPHNNGMLGLAHFGHRLFDDGRTLPNWLSRHGYYCVLDGIQHLSIRPDSARRLGYQENMETGLDSEAVTTRALEFLDRARGDRPFFLDVGYFPPHRLEDFFPYSTPRPNPNFVPVPAGLPDVPAVREDMADFLASVQTLDAHASRVLDGLRERSLMDDTLVIATTDHGNAFPTHKCNLTDRGTGVMLIVRGPGGFTGGRAIDAMVSQLDLYPTVCELAGIPTPDHCQGRSLLPLVRGEAVGLHEELFAEINYHSSYEPLRAVRTDRWKYIRRYHDRPNVVLSNIDDGACKTFLYEHGWLEQARPRESFHDLYFDPEEKNNLVADESRRGVVEDCRRRLENWMRATDDPLLTPGGLDRTLWDVHSSVDEYHPGRKKAPPED